jgi:hypothetical protein
MIREEAHGSKRRWAIQIGSMAMGAGEQAVLGDGGASAGAAIDSGASFFLPLSSFLASFLPLSLPFEAGKKEGRI